MKHETKSIAIAAGLAVSVFAAGAASAQSTQVIFYEGFEGAILEDSVDESTGDVTSPYANFWTDTPPAGWSIDDSGVPFLGDPDEGVEEWEGWAFTDLLLWNDACGDGRGGFANLASGTVAVADGDEWDDLGNPEAGGPMVTLLETPAVNVSADAGGTVTLNFDSSWRYEEPQIVWIEASFNGGAPVRFLEWTWDDSQPAVGSGGSGNQIGFKDDHFENGESQSVSIDVPGGATSMTLTFGYSGVNDWWWAIDNVEITGNGGQYLFEDFEGLVLEDSVDERIGAPDPMVWTDELAGWTFDDSQMQQFVDDPAEGVEEWEGWAIANGVWWATVAGDQRRTDFVSDAGALATGNVLIADPDEWDDKGNSPAAGGAFNASVTTPEISIDGVAAGTMSLNFYSSWRNEEPQLGTIAVSFDGGDFNEIARWDTTGINDVDPNGAGNQFGNKPTATNEVVSIAIANPEASTMQVRFAMPVADNDWWWAIDDVQIVGETGSAATNLPSPFFIDIPSHNTDLNPTLSYGIGIEGGSADSFVPGAEDFTVTVAKDAGFTDVRYTETTATGPFVFPQGALQAGVYWVKVEANNAVGTRASTNTVQFSVSNPCTVADGNGDGLLDLSDITIFTSGFTTACP